MSDLLHRIQRAQVEAAEDVVIAHLQEQGLAKEEPFIRVPVFSGFADSAEIIGELRVLRSALPAAPNYHFALGGKVVEQHGDEITKFELVSIAIVADKEFTRER